MIYRMQDARDEVARRREAQQDAAPQTQQETKRPMKMQSLGQRIAGLNKKMHDRVDNMHKQVDDMEKQQDEAFAAQEQFLQSARTDLEQMQRELGLVTNGGNVS